MRCCCCTHCFHHTFPLQARLAQITEIIHVASLIHDDVVDDGTMRRGIPALNVAHGSKTAVLAGDFLLARAR
jgi:geranyl diphosphate synthase